MISCRCIWLAAAAAAATAVVVEFKLLPVTAVRCAAAAATATAAKLLFDEIDDADKRDDEADCGDEPSTISSIDKLDEELDGADIRLVDEEDTEAFVFNTAVELVALVFTVGAIVELYLLNLL